MLYTSYVSSKASAKIQYICDNHKGFFKNNNYILRYNPLAELDKRIF
jgi:hypothetical protein